MQEPRAPRLGPSECLSGVLRRHREAGLLCLSEVWAAVDSLGNVSCYLTTLLG